jgi:hypothetical protein
MPDPRIGENLFDRVDRTARHAHLVQPLDPIGVRVLADQVGQMRVAVPEEIGVADGKRADN